MKIVLATSNLDKVREIKNLLSDKYTILTPKDLNIANFEVEEDGETLEANAYIKAKELFNLVNLPTLADDTGLFVKALDNRPGVKSHRYAGDNPTYYDNRKKMLKELEGKTDRFAYFKTAICYIDIKGQEHYFTGKIKGTITDKDYGDNEFGYDQIFKPETSKLTFGQMSKKNKNDYSHRSLALEKLINFLEENK